MRVVLTRKMVVGHVMRYPGEVVEIPDDRLKIEDVTVQGDPSTAAPSTAAAASAQDDLAQDDSQHETLNPEPETGRRRRKT